MRRFSTKTRRHEGLSVLLRVEISRELVKNSNSSRKSSQKPVGGQQGVTNMAMSFSFGPIMLCYSNFNIFQ